jgi:hypothetical protein
MTQSSDDPALGDLHTDLDLGLGEKRALQTVAVVTYKFSPSHTLSIL